MSESIAISVIVPAYNEGVCISQNLERIYNHLRQRGSFELIVVDDGGKDDTAAQVSKFAQARPEIQLLRLSENCGKGGAVKAGMDAARGSLCCFVDADLGFPIEELDKMIPYVSQGYACVIGSRRIPGAQGDAPQPHLRRFLGKCFSAISSCLLVPGIHDFTCGIKLFSQEAAREIFSRQTINRWGFDTEILFLARHLGFRIKEVPIHWSHRLDSKVRIMRDVVQSLRDLCVITKNRISGIYGPRRPGALNT